MSEFEDEYEDDFETEFDLPGAAGEGVVVDAQAPDPRKQQLAGVGLENRAHFTAMATATARSAEAVAARLVLLEERLILLDRMLRVSQPPIIGKLGVRWWQRRGNDPYRKPVLVSWHRLRNGRWRARPVSQVRRDRISREGTAAMNAEATYWLALSASRLIKAYGALAAGLSKGGRDLDKCHAKTERVLLDANAMLRVGHMTVMRNLRAAGYEVDRYVMNLLEGHDLA